MNCYQPPRAAWEQAQPGGSLTPWLRLASFRQRDLPEDAIPTCQRDPERSIETAATRRETPSWQRRAT